MCHRYGMARWTIGLVACVALALGATGCTGTQERIDARVTALEEQYQQAMDDADAAEEAILAGEASGAMTPEEAAEALEALEEARAERARQHELRMRAVFREEYARAYEQGAPYVDGGGQIIGGAATGNWALVLGGVANLVALFSSRRARERAEATAKAEAAAAERRAEATAKAEAAAAEQRVHATRNESRELQGMVGHDKRSIVQATGGRSGSIVPMPQEPRA